MEKGSLNNPEAGEVMKELKEELMDPTAEGVGMAHVFGLSPEEVKSTYLVACQKLAQNDILEASKLFCMLVALDHNEFKHWRGLGICGMRAQQFFPAAFCFTRALIKNPNDVVSLVFRGEARVNTGQVILGREDLESAISKAATSKDRDDQNYGKRAKAVLKMMDAGDDAGASFDR